MSLFLWLGSPAKRAVCVANLLGEDAPGILILQRSWGSYAPAVIDLRDVGGDHEIQLRLFLSIDEFLRRTFEFVTGNVVLSLLTAIGGGGGEWWYSFRLLFPSFSVHLNQLFSLLSKMATQRQ